MVQPRPRGELGEQTRQRLLESAELLFARRGFACTSVREITRDAHCNVAAVSYHFGGKLQLYSEMFMRRLVLLREQRLTSISAAREGAPAEGGLEHVLRVFASAFLEPLVDESRGRHLIELISREILDPQMEPKLFYGEVFGPVNDALAEAIIQSEPGLSSGAARRCVMSVVSQLIQVAHGIRQRRLVASSEVARVELAECLDHIVKFSAAGVRACQGEESRC